MERDAAFGGSPASGLEPEELRALAGQAGSPGMTHQRTSRPPAPPAGEPAALRSRSLDFARALGGALTALGGTRVEARLDAAEAVEYCRFARSLPCPTSVHRLALPGAAGDLVVEVSPALLDSLLRCRQGRGLEDGGRQGRAPPAPLAQLDRDAARLRIDEVGPVLLAISRAFAGTFGLEEPARLERVSSDTNPLLLQAHPPGERVLHIACELRMGTDLGMVNVAFPSSSPAGKAGDAAAGEVATAALCDPHFRLGDLLLLREGDLLDTGLPAPLPPVAGAGAAEAVRDVAGERRR